MRDTTNSRVPIPAPMRQITDTIERVGVCVDFDIISAALGDEEELPDTALRDVKSLFADSPYDRSRLRSLRERITPDGADGGVHRIHTRHRMAAKTHTITDEAHLHQLHMLLPEAVTVEPGRVLVEIDVAVNPWQSLAKLAGDQDLEDAALSADLYGYVTEALNAHGGQYTRTEVKQALFRGFFIPRRRGFTRPAEILEPPEDRLARTTVALFEKAARYREEAGELGGGIDHVHRLQHDVETDALVDIWGRLPQDAREHATLLVLGSYLYLEVTTEDVPLVADAVTAGARPGTDREYVGRYGITTDVCVRTGSNLLQLRPYRR